RIIRYRRDQVPAWLADVRVDGRRVAEEVRLPLVGVATEEAVEIIEAHTSRPLIEWPGLARLELRRVVVLTKPGRPVALVLEYFADRRLVPCHDAVVAGIACRLLGNDSEAHRMMVSSRDQRAAPR